MHVLTENEVRDLARRIEPGSKFTIPEGAILTPMARDYLRSRSIDVVEQHGTRSHKHAPSESSAPSADDALIDAVTAEVQRLLKPAAQAETAAGILPHHPPSKSAPPSNTRAVVWAIGGDRPGILAAVAELLGRHKVNILEISQTILSGVFAMVMIVDISQSQGAFVDMKGELETLGKSLGVTLSAQRDEIFQYMHRI